MESYLSFFAPQIAAGLGIVPAYPFFARKSAKQTEQPMPKVTLREAVGAVPKIAAIVGTQMVAQQQIEQLMNSYAEGHPFSKMVGSSVLVGGISVPALAIFNGHTLGWSVKKSLKALNRKQTGAILVRETSFLVSIRVNDPLCAWLKSQFGDNKTVEIAGAFFTGAVGSLIGHPADTALTRWQKGMKVQSKDLMRGGGYKAVGVGFFTICYRIIFGLFE